MALDRRRFLSQIGRASIGVGAATGFAGAASHLFAAFDASSPLRVCLVSGSEEYKSNESLASFQKQLEGSYPICCSRAFWTSKNNLPGLEALETCDVMVLFTKRLEVPPAQLERVKAYCNAGRPIVGLRTASHAFQDWLALDSEVFGGSYSGHYKSGPITELSVVNGGAGHPVLKGFVPFNTPTKLYKNPRLAKDTTLLLTGTIPGHKEPVAWTRIHRGGRVFYTSLGGPEDFEIDAFRRMVVNAIYWTTRRG